MCLIPTEVVREIGLSLPLFIKWDDSEYGVRAQAAGYPTITMPGVAVWHVPWTDKNDALDWQAYFHQRNRFVAALLHSPFPHGGRMIRESFNHQLKHLLAMQYSTVELRHLALEDALAGPDQLHDDLPVKLGAGARAAQAVQRRPAQGRPGRLPAAAAREAAQEGHGLRDPRARLASCSPRSRGRSASSSAPASCRGSSPSRRCRPWTPAGSGWPPSTRPS